MVEYGGLNTYQPTVFAEEWHHSLCIGDNERGSIEVSTKGGGKQPTVFMGFRHPLNTTAPWAIIKLTELIPVMCIYTHKNCRRKVYGVP